MIEGKENSQIDLGRRRYAVSRALGTEFAEFLEGKEPSPEGLEDLVKEVQLKLSEEPERQILGIFLKPDIDESDVVQSLNEQVGLFKEASWRDIGDRVYDRKDDFLVVMVSSKDCPKREKKKLKRRVKKKLGLEVVSN
jgi:hypothetical protein